MTKRKGSWVADPLAGTGAGLPAPDAPKKRLTKDQKAALAAIEAANRHLDGLATTLNRFVKFADTKMLEVYPEPPKLDKYFIRKFELELSDALPEYAKFGLVLRYDVWSEIPSRRHGGHHTLTLHKVSRGGNKEQVSAAEGLLDSKGALPTLELCKAVIIGLIEWEKKQ